MNNTLPKAPSRKSAFTLIELSIVLVIIGLITGGVLVARDLIEVSKARQLMGELQTFEVGYNTFRLKYNCIPGDCKNAEQFGFVGNGDGSKIIDVAAGAQCVTDTSIGQGLRRESVNFWSHLSMAEFINYEFDGITGSGLGTTSYSEEETARFLPKSRAFEDHYFHVYSRCGKTLIRTGVENIHFGSPEFKKPLNSDTVRYITDKQGSSSAVDESCGTNFCIEPPGKALPVAGYNHWIHVDTPYANPTFVYNGAGVAGNVACMVDSGGGNYIYQTDGFCNVAWKIN